MSWPDSAHLEECADDLELRSELKGLLGVSPGEALRPKAVLTPEIVGLAEELQREAQRRSRVVPLQRRSTWPLLLAAGLPIALVLGGMGVWGATQKRRADQMAAAVQQKDAEVQRLAKVTAEAAAEAQATTSALLQVKSAPVRNGAKPQELVLPADNRVNKAPLDTQTVSNPSR